MHCEESEREREKKKQRQKPKLQLSSGEIGRFFSSPPLIRDNCTLHKLMCFLFTFYEVLTIFFASPFCMMFYSLFLSLTSTNDCLQFLKEGDFRVEEIHILDLKMEWKIRKV